MLACFMAMSAVVTAVAETSPLGCQAGNTANSKRRPPKSSAGSRRRANGNLHHRSTLERCTSTLTEIPVTDGISHTNFCFYLGEHQSQIFYGGLNINRVDGLPPLEPIHVELGKPIPIDLREDLYSEHPATPCLAVPMHIFRRFRNCRSSHSHIKRHTDSSVLSLSEPCHSGVDLSHLSTQTYENGVQSEYKSSDYTSLSAQHPLPSLHRSTTALISLRVYFPVQFMNSANMLQAVTGSRKRVHLYPHHDEVVAYPGLLTLPIGKFANRVIRGVMQADRLLDCSSSLPTCLLSDASYALLDSSRNSDSSALAEATDSPSAVATNSPAPSFSVSSSCTYLILPVTTYNRFATSKRMLLEGFHNPPPHRLGLEAVASSCQKPTSDVPTASAPTDTTVSWSQWVGLGFPTPGLSKPPLAHVQASSSSSSLANLDCTHTGDENCNPDVRVCFVRRQSEDCGIAISPALRKNMFGPARIRRTRMKGTDRLVMKLKQLIQGDPSTDEKATSSNDSNDEQRTGETAAWVTDADEGTARPRYKYFWSRDCRSDPNLFLLGRRLEEAEARLEEGTIPSSVTNGSTDEDDQRAVNTERWHRPMRSCLPPQRLEVVDRDLEKALQRSLADGRRTVCSTATLAASQSADEVPRANRRPIKQVHRNSVRAGRTIRAENKPKSEEVRSQNHPLTHTSSPADTVGTTTVTDCSLSVKEQGQTTPPTLTSLYPGAGPIKLKEASIKVENSTSAPSPTSSAGLLQQSRQRRRRTFRFAIMKRHRNRKTTPPPPLLSPNTPPRDGVQAEDTFVEDYGTLPSPQRSSGIPKLTLTKCENGQFSVVPSARDEPDGDRRDEDPAEVTLALTSTPEEEHSISPPSPPPIPPPPLPSPPKSAFSLPPLSPTIPPPASQDNGKVYTSPAETPSREDRIGSPVDTATAERGSVLLDSLSGMKPTSPEIRTVHTQVLPGMKVQASADDIPATVNSPNSFPFLNNSPVGLLDNKTFFNTAVHASTCISQIQPDPQIPSTPQPTAALNPTQTSLQPCTFNFRWHDADDQLVPTPQTMWTRRMDPLPAPDCTVYPTLPPPPAALTTQVQPQTGRQVSTSPTSQPNTIQLPPCQQPPHFQPTVLPPQFPPSHPPITTQFLTSIPTPQPHPETGPVSLPMCNSVTGGCGLLANGFLNMPFSSPNMAAAAAAALATHMGPSANVSMPSLALPLDLYSSPQMQFMHFLSPQTGLVPFHQMTPATLNLQTLNPSNATTAAAAVASTTTITTTTTNGQNLTPNPAAPAPTSGSVFTFVPPLPEVSADVAAAAAAAATATANGFFFFPPKPPVPAPFHITGLFGTTAPPSMCGDMASSMAALHHMQDQLAWIGNNLDAAVSNDGSAHALL
uniref:DUF3715 domain-containing protein n=1 Tax=Schistocephalus solidus TaxID=70667 RepID=A0A0X3PCW7_SCHSO